MLTITSSVGKNGTNRSHDVRLIQTALKLLKKANGQPYLAGKCDGRYGNQTGGAITAFQNEHLFSSGQKPPDEMPGLIRPGGKTLATLTGKLPQEYRAMRIIPNTLTVYLGQPQSSYVAFRGIFFPYTEFAPDFKSRLTNLIAKMYADHGIVLSIPNNGWRRSFAVQWKIYDDNKSKKVKTTESAAGESNHQYGNAVDLGFDGLQWFDDEGRLVKENHWLKIMLSKSYRRFSEFWKTRDDIATSFGIKKTNLANDLIHLQSYEDGRSQVSMGRSLAVHLTTVSNQKTGNNHAWGVKLSGPNIYLCDYGLGGEKYSVGEAQDIWIGRVDVKKENLAAALNAKLQKDAKFKVVEFFGEKPAANAAQPPSYTASQIKDSYVKTIKDRLVADFKAADAHWILWKPVPR